MSKSHFAACALALAAIGVTACNGPHDGRVNSGLCADFKTPRTAPMAASDGALSVDDCTRRWAYSLSPGHDSAEVVAEAVAAACSTQLTRWNQQSLAAPQTDGEAASILTGEPTTPIGEHNSFTRSRALFYVVQARAGKCAAPKIVNGVPEGVS